MRPLCLLIRRSTAHSRPLCHQRRQLLTLAIETSCDDTSVAVLEKHANHSATLHFNSKITSDNRAYGGVNPLAAHESHQKVLAGLVKEALQHLPIQRTAIAHLGNSLLVPTQYGGEVRKKPDFVTVTRGPGMRASLITGVDTAKGLAVAWQVPFLGINHMQAHALTPRLVSALDADDANITTPVEKEPNFPFLSLLVSGGHTMLVHSRDLCHHEILASTSDIAIGNLIDKNARAILPPRLIESTTDVMYGRLLEKFAFPGEQPEYEYIPSFNSQGNFARLSTPYERSFLPPLMQRPYDMEFTFSGLNSEARRWMVANPDMDDNERRFLARETMRVAFEHLASRVIIALESPELKDVRTLVVSGGVASNQFLKHVLRTVLDCKGHTEMVLVFPPPRFCTDNAAMIAWTGIEMWEAGWRTDLEVTAVNKWAIDPNAEDGGILGLDGWRKA